jgi:hypothetical protein
MKRLSKPSLVLIFLSALLTLESISAQENELIKLPKDSEIDILYPGDYKKGEFDIHFMDREWWGVYARNNRSYLKKVHLTLDKLEPDVQYDWEYRISVQEKNDWIFLVSGLNLNEKSFEHYTGLDFLDKNKEFTFQHGPYHTFLSSKLESEETVGDVKKYNYSIHLNYNTNEHHYSQELFMFPCYGEELIMRLIWAGDIDNDEKTDFLLQIPTPPFNEIGDATGLFLSSKASPNELVKLVAYFISKGC